MAVDQTQAEPDREAVAAALAVLDRFMAALNAGDEAALLATLHFPHYRLAGGLMRVWENPGPYLGDFLARAGADWHHSAWDFRQRHRRRAGEGASRRAVHPLSRRQFRDRPLPLAMDRDEKRRALGGRGAVELRRLGPNPPRRVAR